MLCRMFTLLRGFLKKVLPLSHPRVIAAIRRSRNLRAWPVAMLPWKRRQLRAGLARCQTFDQLFTFAGTALRGGALQNIKEISAAIDYIRSENPRNFCEIGTANGGANLLVSHSLASIELIIGIDLFIMNRSALRLLLRPSQQIHLLNGSSYEPRTFQRVRSLLTGRTIDLLFIDGDHRYQGVKQDFLLYSQLVRDGGLIMFHDIIPDHASRYGRSSMNCAGDVPRLWNQLKMHFRYQEFFRDPAQDGLGLGILHWSRSVSLPELSPP